MILLFLIQSTVDSNSFSKDWKGSFRFLKVTAMVLLSAKLCKSEFVSHMNKSFLKMLNRRGPSIESSGTPKKNVYESRTITFFLSIVSEVTSRRKF